MPNSPATFVSQGSGSYNNFRGNNFKPKGKWKRFYPYNNNGYQFNGSNSQSFQQLTFSQSQPIYLYSDQQQFVSRNYNPIQVCQICDMKGHSALTCFHRKCHTAATCFDRSNPQLEFQSLPMPSSQGNQSS